MTVLGWWIVLIAPLGTLVFGALAMAIVGTHWWHVRYHVGRSVIRPFSCDHCCDVWSRQTRRPNRKGSAP